MTLRLAAALTISTDVKLDAVHEVTRALIDHHVFTATVRDGLGRLLWEDDGGLYCQCGTSFPAGHGVAMRPWSAWEFHRAEVVFDAVARAAGLSIAAAP